MRCDRGRGRYRQSRARVARARCHGPLSDRPSHGLLRQGRGVEDQADFQAPGTATQVNLLPWVIGEDDARTLRDRLRHHQLAV